MEAARRGQGRESKPVGKDATLERPAMDQPWSCIAPYQLCPWCWWTCAGDEQRRRSSAGLILPRNIPHTCNATTSSKPREGGKRAHAAEQGVKRSLPSITHGLGEEPGQQWLSECPAPARPGSQVSSPVSWPRRLWETRLAPPSSAGASKIRTSSVSCLL